MEPSDLVSVNCAQCGSQNLEEVFADNPSKLVKCRDCQLVFFNPLPSGEYLKSFYSSQTGYLSSIEENLKSFEADSHSWQDTANYILYKIYQHLPEEKGQRLLDVGSAYGFFLIFAKKRGLDVLGLELSTETSRYARQQGIEVLNTSLMDTDLKDGSFDIVTMNNVLEHTLNPIAEVKKAFSILKPSGILYIGVPNWDSMVSRVDGYNWKMKSWPNHLFYFTAETLGVILAKAGFTVRESFSFMGESDYQDDARIIREKLLLQDEKEIRQVIECLWKLGKGQELVMIAQKS
jgi:2-polyprenyl-3-methyl-5-hydroxy-6-metoxy-1,4-benzoquinol methylase